MREPFETLLGGLRSTWVADYLHDDIPDWGGIARDDRSMALSSGEGVLIDIALAIHNGDTAAHVADIAKLDAANRWRAVSALWLAYVA